MAKTVLFISGAWMHVSSWDKFRALFTEAGYETHGAGHTATLPAVQSVS